MTHNTMSQASTMVTTHYSTQSLEHVTRKNRNKYRNRGSKDNRTERPSRQSAFKRSHYLSTAFQGKRSATQETQNQNEEVQKKINAKNEAEILDFFVCVLIFDTAALISVC